jgi:TM2 domain-containing membrane protein YozV
MAYFMAIDGAQQGPFELAELPERGLRPETLIWTEGMPDWQRADSHPETRRLLWQHPYAPAAPPLGRATAGMPAATTVVTGNRIAAGVCGILLGSLGIHKFILGYTQAGLIMLLVTLFTCGLGGIVMSVIGIIEGITYLTKSDEEFHGMYVAGRKEWF